MTDTLASTAALTMVDSGNGGTSPATDNKTATIVVKDSRNSAVLGRPKRPLSAYNLFFRDEREKLMRALPPCLAKPSKRGNDKNKAHYKISFSDLGKIIGLRWKNVDKAIKEGYEAAAEAGRSIYKERIAAWRKQQENLGLPTKRKNQRKTKTTLRHRISSSGKSISDTPASVARSAIAFDDLEPLQFDQAPSGHFLSGITTGNNQHHENQNLTLLHFNQKPSDYRALPPEGNPVDQCFEDPLDPLSIFPDNNSTANGLSENVTMSSGGQSTGATVNTSFHDKATTTSLESLSAVQVQPNPFLGDATPLPFQWTFNRSEPGHDCKHGGSFAASTGTPMCSYETLPSTKASQYVNPSFGSVEAPVTEKPIFPTWFS